MRIYLLTNLLILTTITVLTFSTNVIGQDDPVAVRQASMKQVGDASKILGNMVRGKIEYNSENAQKALTQIRDAVAIFVENFPEGSNTGKTEAAPENLGRYGRISSSIRKIYEGCGRSY